MSYVRHTYSLFFLFLAFMTLMQYAPCAHAENQNSNSGSINTNVLARNRTLYTSSVAYCGAPTTVFLKRLDLRYKGDDQQFDFDVQVSSTRGDEDFGIIFDLYVYGRKYVTVHQDLCKIGNGELCPIPKYNFTGSSHIKVPDSFAAKIPNIVFDVPDIEALAMLKLYDQPTQNLSGCLQVQLSNAKTVDLPDITYGLAAFVAAAALASLVTTGWSHSLSSLQWRIVDIVTTIQLTPMVSMITMIVPRVIHVFSLRFSWIMGLVRIESIYESILDSRKSTGSDDVHLVFGQLMEAEYSRLANYYPASVLNANKSAEILDVNGISSLDLHTLQPRKLYAPNTGPGGELDPGGAGDNVVWAVSMNDFDQSGVFYYTESLNISPYSAFLIALVSWLLVVCIALCIGILVAGFVGFLSKRDRLHNLHRLYLQLLRPTLLRVYECATPPLLTLALFQFVNSTSWLSHFIAALTCFALACLWSIIFAQQYVQARRAGAESLYYIRTWPWDMTSAALHIGSMSHPWKPRYWWFWFLMLGCGFLRACFVGIPQKHNYGLRQSVGLLTIDVLLLIVFLVCRPGRDVKNNIVQCILCIFRVIAWALCVSLTTTANVWGIPRAVLGFVLLAVLALPIVFLFLVFLYEVVEAPLAKSQIWSPDHLEPRIQEQGEEDCTVTTPLVASQQKFE